MDARKSNKIRDIVGLLQMVKKWKKLAAANSNNNSKKCNSNSNRGIKFLKKTLSFSDNTVSSVSSCHYSENMVPKGYLAVCVGKELKRYVIPTHYLGHQAFGILLREAEEEFGFHQEGVLKIPCDIPVFEMILKAVEEKRDGFFLHDLDLHSNSSDNSADIISNGHCSPDCELIHSFRPQICR